MDGWMVAWLGGGKPQCGNDGKDNELRAAVALDINYGIHHAFLSVR